MTMCRTKLRADQQKRHAGLLRRSTRKETFGLHVETLEQRCLLTGLVDSMESGETVATDNSYRTDEDTALVGNVLTDDTGDGADRSTPVGARLVNRPSDFRRERLSTEC